jgi:F-type H+-transporting ATPase subunit delta
MQNNKKVHTAVNSLKKFLASGGSLSDLTAVSQEVKDIIKQHQRRDTIQITSAIELSATSKVKIESTLTKVTSHPVKCSYQISPEVLGGLKVRIGDHILDMTILNRINQMAEALKQSYR